MAEKHGVAVGQIRPGLDFRLNPNKSQAAAHVGTLPTSGTVTPIEVGGGVWVLCFTHTAAFTIQVMIKSNAVNVDLAESDPGEADAFIPFVTLACGVGVSKYVVEISGGSHLVMKGSAAGAFSLIPY